MQTKVSSKGQVVLPISIRNRLHILEGDPLEVLVENERVVLVPKKRRKFKTWVETSPVTGLPVIVSEKGAPKITSDWVAQMMEEIP